MSFNNSKNGSSMFGQNIVSSGSYQSGSSEVVPKYLTGQSLWIDRYIKPTFVKSSQGDGKPKTILTCSICQMFNICRSGKTGFDSYVPKASGNSNVVKTIYPLIMTESGKEYKVSGFITYGILTRKFSEHGELLITVPIRDVLNPNESGPEILENNEKAFSISFKLFKTDFPNLKDLVSEYQAGDFVRIHCKPNQVKGQKDVFEFTILSLEKKIISPESFNLWANEMKNAMNGNGNVFYIEKAHERVVEMEKLQKSIAEEKKKDGTIDKQPGALGYKIAKDILTVKAGPAARRVADSYMKKIFEGKSFFTKAELKTQLAADQENGNFMDVYATALNYVVHEYRNQGLVSFIGPFKEPNQVVTIQDKTYFKKDGTRTVVT